MKIVIAPDSFKGSMSSKEIIEIIKGVAKRTISPLEVVEVPIADGGEGTIEALVHGSDGHIVGKCIKDPTGQLVKSYYGIIEDTAIVEMAICSGLPMVPDDKRNPMETTSYGTGEMIRHALDAGYRKFLIGIGGSGTNDGGTGAMEALGVKFYDKSGQLLTDMCGGKLKNIDRIDISDLDSRLKSCDIKVMCDVTNPLTGVYGATYVYGPQKGGSPEILDQLEAGMVHYGLILNDLFGRDIGNIPGAGAAGGMGAALCGYLDAELVSGIEAVLETAKFDEKIDGADLIITGEGRVDSQSASGKVVHGVTEYANNKQIPVVVVAGGVGDGVQAVYALGVKAIMTLPNRPMTLETCMTDTKALLEELSMNLFGLLQIRR